MIDIRVQLFGGLRIDFDKKEITLSLQENCSIKDLESHLIDLGIDANIAQNIIMFNDREIHQWPDEYIISGNDRIFVIPHIEGG